MEIKPSGQLVDGNKSCRVMIQLNGQVKELTEEQANNRDIILQKQGLAKHFEANLANHIIILAAAGTGKTTSSLAIPYFSPNDRFLLLTFNNELCGNTKHRVNFDWGLDNIDVYTFHGFMNRYFGTCQNDMDLYELLSRPNLTPKIKMPRWARVCLDEFQDANYGIYAISQLILAWQHKLYPPSNPDTPPTQLIIMGDTLQCLYEYSGADRRFITLAHLIYNPVKSGAKNTFTRLALTQTFRCTKPMVDFINQVMLGYPKMTSTKPGIKPKLHICNIFDISEKHPLYLLIISLIKKAKGDHGKIAIISPAVRNNQTITRLANLLTAKGIPLYISATETDSKNEKRLSQGKLVISSVHKSKGREWPYVVVLGFDDYYHKRNTIGNISNEDENINRPQSATYIGCPDIDYVGVSRAEIELHLVQHFMNGLPKYINSEALPRYVDILEHTKRPLTKSPISGQKPVIYKASEISRHMDISVIRQAIQKLGLQTINPAGKSEQQVITTPNEYLAPDGTVEDISAINGVAVPVWYECHYRKKAPEILGLITRLLGSDNGQLFAKYYNPDWQTKVRNPTEYTVRDVLQMSNLYIGLREGYLYLCRQMEGASWDWISVAQLNESARRINEVIQRLVPPPTGQHQKLVFEKFCSDPKNHISGSIDLYTPMMVFEFKFKSALSTEDVLQTAISLLLGHNIGINELFNTVDNMTEARLESLEHIQEGHIILAYQNGSKEPSPLKVVSNDRSIPHLICCGIKPNQVQEIQIHRDNIVGNLTWLKRQGFIHDKQGCLFNIKTGEIIIINAKRAELEEMLSIILNEKAKMNTGIIKKPSDTEFLEKCSLIQTGIWSGAGCDISSVSNKDY